VELDLPQIAAFVTAAEELHFGRAALRLFLSQQALSKRISRLEQTLGEPLFARRHNIVELTAAGHTFLPYSRKLLETADEAAHAVIVLRARPLRVDVWGPVQSPQRILRDLLPAMWDGQLRAAFEFSMRHSLPAALRALEEGEIDVAFGRPFELGSAWPAGLGRWPFAAEPLAAVLPAGHRLAERAHLTPDDLRQYGVWFPIGYGAPELVSWATRYAAEHAIPLTIGESNLGLEYALAELPAHGPALGLVGLDWRLPGGFDVRVIPIQPAPYYLWWLIWPTGSAHPLLSRLRRLLSGKRDPRLWDGAKPDGWLPAPDLADLPAMPA
jgi:DNA-binding transcriptional LysR family regulator